MDRFLNRNSALALMTVFVLVTGSVGPAQVYAQENEPLHTMAWRGVALDTALQDLVRETALELSWDPLLVAGKTTFCVAREMTREEILACILARTGLDFIRRSNGLYVLELATEGFPLHGNLRGIILDRDTEQPISNAHVLLTEAGRGVIANQQGMFLFPNLLPGKYLMRVSHLGYRPKYVELDIEPGVVSTEVIMDVETIPYVTPIIVEGLSGQPASSVLGSSVATQEEIAIDLDMGASGLLQSLASLSGVRVNDATADVHIQGGESGEHQFRLDGAPVFIPLNVATFIGPFSPFAIGKITVNKAGFGVLHGSQISGVISAEHDLKKPARGARFTAQVDPMSTNLRYSDSWTTRDNYHGTVLGAARVGTWSLLAPPSLVDLLEDWNTVDTFLLSAFAEQNTPFANLPPVGEPAIQFTDLHGATRIRLGALRTFGASAYWGRSGMGNNLGDVDVLDPDPASNPLDQVARFKDTYSWQNGLAQARYDVVQSSHVLTSIRTRGSYYRLTHDFRAPDSASAETTEDDGNFVYEVAAEGRLNYLSNNGHDVETGLELILTGSRFTVAGTQQIPLFHASRSGRLAAFVQDNMQIGNHGSLQVGTRWTWLHNRSTLYGEPRLAVRFDWPDTRAGAFSVYAATGLYRQFVNQFDVSSRSPRTFVSSTRFWMGNDATVTPPKAAHLAGELLWLPTPVWSIGLESFYRHQYQILAVDYSADVQPGQDLVQADFLESSRGYAWGYSASVKRSVGLGNLNARIDRTIARRRMSSLFRNETLTVPWNEPVRLELGADVSPLPNTLLLVRWKSVFGRTWGYRKAYYDFLGAHLNDLDAILEDMRANGVSADAIRRVERQVTHYDLGRPDSHELPAVHQLDVSAAYTRRIQNLTIQGRLEISNVLGRENAAEWRFEMDEESYFGDGDQTGLLERSERLLLPRIVSFALRFSW